MSKPEEALVDRREALKLMGMAAVSVTALTNLRLLKASPVKKIPSKLEKYLTYKYTACGLCMPRCGMKLYMSGGRVVFVDGNPADPVGRGKLCPKGKATLGFLYNPDRLKTPLLRTNPEKGIGVDPGFVPISWEEAFNLIVDKIMEITENGKHGERVAILTEEEKGYAARLLGQIGSPNLLTHHDTCLITNLVARKFMIGGIPWANLKGAKYILTFGWDQLDRAKNNMTQDAISSIFENGAKVVVFNPFRGKIGSLAHEWIPIKPGTDLAVILAMINVILSENRFNKEYVYSRTNFGDHESEIRRHFSQYTPEWAEKISGVPAETIRRIAREFSDPNNQPAIAPFHKRDATGPNYANSFYTAQALIILNALVGAIDREGGHASFFFGWKPKPKLKFVENPPSTSKLAEEKGAIDGKHEFPLVNKMQVGIFSNFADRILREDPYPLKMAIFRRYGLLSFPNPQKVAEALKKLDFVVFVDSMPKEIMWFADLVLPTPTFFEKKTIELTFCKLGEPGYKVLKARQPVPPLYDTRSWLYILVELGKRLDERLGTKYWWLADEEGNPLRPVTVEDIHEAFVKAAGLTPEELEKIPNGIWVKKVHYKPKDKYGTPSGRIEIYSTVFEKYGYDPLPKWVDRHTKPSSEYPFYFLTRRWAGHKQSAPVTSDNPYSLDAFPSPFCWINEETAKKLGINDGDWVYVKSPYGKIKLKAKLTKILRPDCVIVEHAFGHTFPMLRYGGKWPSDGYLMPARPEKLVKELKDWSASAWMLETTVRVEKA